MSINTFSLHDANGRDVLQILKSQVGGPLSGLTGDGAGTARPGSLCIDASTGIVYVNHGTLKSPYWSPVSFHQPNLLGCHEDFRGPVIKAVSDTAVVATGVSGIRAFGQGIAETDSGVAAGTDVEGSRVARMTTTDEDEHTICLGFGSSVAMLQPDIHGPLVIDVIWASVTNILTRRFFAGFLGTVADALDPPFTGATTVVTLVQDDMAGLCMDSNFTDADRIYAAHNKSDAAASMTGIDTGTDLPTAGTYQQWRVEISRTGQMTCFINKTQVAQVAAALDADEEVMPVAMLMVEQGTTALSADVKRFMCWGSRA